MLLLQRSARALSQPVCVYCNVVALHSMTGMPDLINFQRDAKFLEERTALRLKSGIT
jgi:hypothetical protein